jgi:FtsZ-binding cell division protein ZapB|tara:strand:- start:290 stop:460 length:171 start_codon:yes stop_codon:yes gene_type:complete
MDNWEKHYNRKLMQYESRKELLEAKLKNVNDKIFLTKIEYEEIKQKRDLHNESENI